MNIHEPQQSCPKVTACTVATSYGKVTMWRASNNQREHPGKGHGATFPNSWIISHMMYIMYGIDVPRFAQQPSYCQAASQD